MLHASARWLTVILLILSAAAFTTGAIVERATTTESRAAPATADRQATATAAADGGHDSGEPGATAPPSAAPPSAAATGDHGESATRGETSGESGGAGHAETLLGVNPEAIPLVAAAVLLSLVLAAAVLGVRSRWLLPGVAVIMVAFAALDIREITHQVNESRPGLAALAAAVALLHLLAAASALLARRAALHPPMRSQAATR